MYLGTMIVGVLKLWFMSINYIIEHKVARYSCY